MILWASASSAACRARRAASPTRRRSGRSGPRAAKKTKPAPDLIGRDFHAERPGTKLVGDFTYLPLAGGEFLYLAMVLDLATREVVGWFIVDRMRTGLVAGRAADGGLDPLRQ
ncbi:DDE-type integrase/transposase/recombinase [Streptomyces sp. NPDC048419]|uniref:DDE-type integrase/transposase/recombinase n=1 Tax=Streptomyces sp. NPDC048419 TaxID=3365547 RepID=UPI0037197B70